MINQNELREYLQQGMSTRDIEALTGDSRSNISYWIDKWDIKDLMKYKKPEYNDVHYFNKIDSKEKAYIIGFLIGDGHICKDKTLKCSIALQDKEILNFISAHIGCNIHIDNTTNIKMRKFPNATIIIGNRILCDDISKLFGGRLKPDRRLPIIRKDLERYLVQGFFDAEGCITWGIRKDRNRIWQKVSFTSQLKMLQGIQNILLKQNIASSIKPKGKDKCYVLDFSDKNRVRLFLDFIYPNNEFIILNRKYNKAQALRLELGEFGEV
jgi:hypothetical protein